MFRPNFAQDAPPESISVGGADCPVNVDFRIWIDVLDLARELYPTVGTLEEARHNARVLESMQRLAFGRALKASPAAVLRAMMEFARGYPTMVGEGADDGEGEELLSFDYDINAIVLAIEAQYGLDLSYRRKEPFHWWEFLLRVRGLCGDHYILRVMELRASRDTRREARLARRRVRLPTSPRRKRGGNWRPCAPPPGMERKEKIMHIDTQTTPCAWRSRAGNIPSRPARRAWRKKLRRVEGSGPARGQAAPQSGNGATFVAVGPQGRARVVPARRRGRPRPP